MMEKISVDISNSKSKKEIIDLDILVRGSSRLAPFRTNEKGYHIETAYNWGGGEFGVLYHLMYKGERAVTFRTYKMPDNCSILILANVIVQDPYTFSNSEIREKLYSAKGRLIQQLSNWLLSSALVEAKNDLYDHNGNLDKELIHNFHIKPTVLMATVVDDDLPFYLEADFIPRYSYKSNGSGNPITVLTKSVTLKDIESNTES